MRDFMLIMHFVGLAMSLGVGFAYMMIRIFNADLVGDEAFAFTKRTFVLSRMGHIGLFLLLVSGFYLLTPYWQNLIHVPLLVAKLFVVLLQIIAVILLARYSALTKKENTQIYLNKIEVLGKISFALGITIVVLAVLVFH